MSSEDQSFRRGSIFGFTIAEVVLLLLFCLLMALALRLIKLHKAYEIDKIVYERIENEFLKKVTNDDDVLVVKQEFRKFVEDEQDKLQKQHIKYDELKSIILFAGDDFYKDKSNDEKYKILKEKMLLGSVLSNAGFDANTDPKELAKLFEIKKVMDKTGNDSPSDAIQKAVDLCNADKENTENGYNKCVSDLNKLTNTGFGVQPCWVDKNQKEIYVFNIEINPNGFRVTKAYDEDEVKLLPMYDLIKQYDLLMGEQIDRDDFKQIFYKLGRANLKSSYNKDCKFSSYVIDKTPDNAKILYKQRTGDVSTFFRQSSKNPEQKTQNIHVPTQRGV